MTKKTEECLDAQCHDTNCTNPEHYNFECLDPNCHEDHCELEAHYNRKMLKKLEKIENTEKSNSCYDADCEKSICKNPGHYNYICMDPSCDDEHCEIEEHYNKQLLKEYQNSTDFSQFDHREEIDYDEDVDIKLCSCEDCADDEHEHHHEHEHSHDDCCDDDCSCHDEKDDCCDDECSCHDEKDDCCDDECSCHDEKDDCCDDECSCHDEKDDCCDDECSCHDEKDDCCDDECSCHDEKDDCCDDECSCHDEKDDCCDDECSCHDEKDSCCCDDDCCDDNIKICNCDDCADDDDDDEPVIAEGKPLLANRSIQIIVSSGILFVLGHILEYFNIMNGALVTPVYMIGAIIAGYEIAIMGWKAITKRHTISPAVLMTIACIASFIIGHPEEGAAITFLYYIAEFLEDYSELRAQNSIKSLVEIAPEVAKVKVGNTEEERKVDDVNIGEIVIVKPGDKIPLDGKVISGVSSVNQASITGESIPVTKNIGDKVYSGTVNEEGYLEIEVTKKSKDSVISKIVTLVKRSQLNRSHTETLVEKIAKYYTPAMVVITLCVAFIPPLILGGGMPVFEEWVYRALSIMVISCPCAFLISTPIGMVSSITSATRQGVIIKGSTHVEEMRNIKAVIFDKTGTLTEGKLEVVDVKVVDEHYSENELIQIAASLENKSSHPIGLAIVNYAQEKSINLLNISEFKNIPGKGIIGKFGDYEYYAANESLIEGSNFEIDHNQLVEHSKNGETIVFVGNQHDIMGIISVKDKIREESKNVVSTLNNAGIKTIMLTGDNKEAAKTVANQIGIQYAYSNLMPEDKLNILDTIRNKFGDVAMVGDGINDAPALARANVGIAMGAVGSDVAIETADVALMQDDLTKLPYLFRLSRKTMGIIKQNIIVSITVKFLFVILAILGLITLMMAVGIGDLGLTLLVIFNSFRIGFVKDSIF